MTNWHFTGTNGKKLFVTGAGDEHGKRQIAFRVEDAEKGISILLSRNFIVDTLELLRPWSESIRTFSDANGVHFEIHCSGGESPVQTVHFYFTATDQQRLSFDAPLAMAREIFEYSNWMIDHALQLPRFILRIRKAFAVSKPDMDIDTCISELKTIPDDEIAKVLMNLAGRNRIDLAIKILEGLSRKGRMQRIDADSANSYYEWEQPKGVSWLDLVRWSGTNLELPKFEFIDRSKYESLVRAYQPADYVNCFQTAFEEQFESIPFATLDFRETQARLKKLSEGLDAYFAQVVYPPAGVDEVVPYVVADHQWTEGLGFGYTQFLYTPPVWHDEVRRMLLFAHRICFEDPLPQIIRPITDRINNRTYHYDGYLIEPDQIHASHFDLLRRTLLNVQSMARLIRAGLVIPHCLLNERIPNYSEGEYSSVRFRDESSYFLAEEFANVLGALISEGRTDGFHLPPYIVDRAKKVAPERGDWKKIGWFSEFFDEISIHDDSLPSDDPIRNWPDYMYRVALYERYTDSSGLGYAPHFLQKEGYQVYSLLEAADLSTSAIAGNGHKLSGIKYARTLGSDKVSVSRLGSLLKPRFAVLTDDDLVSMRLQDDLFERWRGVVRDSLKVVREYEIQTGQRDARLLTAEIGDRFGKWQSDSTRRLKSHMFRGLIDVGEGAAVSVIGGLALGEPESLASIALGAAYTTLKTIGRTFAWRGRERLFNRHFLSVL